MEIVLDIPNYFVEEYKKDQFSETLNRIYADVYNYGVICSKEEVSVLVMLCLALKNSHPDCSEQQSWREGR